MKQLINFFHVSSEIGSQREDGLMGYVELLFIWQPIMKTVQDQ